jgi:hypothetical protein
VLPPGFGPAEADPEAAAADASTPAQPDLPESSGPLPAEAEDSGLAPLSPARSADRTFGEALKLMDDLAGVKAAMAMLTERGREPAQAPPAHGGSGSQKGGSDHLPSAEFPPLAGGAPSGAAGSASSGTGSAALYALMIVLAASVLGLWGRLQLVPVRWRSVAVVALVERPG